MNKTFINKFYLNSYKKYISWSCQPSNWTNEGNMIFYQVKNPAVNLTFCQICQQTRFRECKALSEKKCWLKKKNGVEERTPSTLLPIPNRISFFFQTFSAWTFDTLLAARLRNWFSSIDISMKKDTNDSPLFNLTENNWKVWSFQILVWIKFKAFQAVVFTNDNLRNFSLRFAIMKKWHFNWNISTNCFKYRSFNSKV